ncbi:MAG: peptide chain release factor 1 [Thermoguttaceae bacterium]|nr:peptide chain release factor 1 [Thermoguttaceae bacterium]MBQ6616813.1 peptide chain release factor 1 [Thermoguttaceae bacterium]
MKKYLEEKLARFEELEKLLQDPAVLADGPRMAAVAREHGSIAKVATAYRTLKDFNRQIQEANDLINGHDPELKELAEAELPELKAQREQVWESLIDMTAGGEDSNRTKLILEIRAGTGGDEAALFARDLYDMYTHYAENNRWKVEIMDMNATELGGFKEIVLGISGENVYQKLQYESGGHRVQRVPETEAKGRIQTSAATVAVMPEPEDVEVDLKPEDYRLDRFCSSGPGGQHVNKTSSAIRLTHYATGIVVQCQDEKSQHKNLAKALRVLKTRIYEKLHEEEEAKRSDDRKTKIGSGDRSQRIRTYNYPENRVTDHRIGLTIYKLDSIIAGNMDPIIDGLLEYERQEQRLAFGTLD